MCSCYIVRSSILSSHSNLRWCQVMLVSSIDYHLGKNERRLNKTKYTYQNDRAVPLAHYSFLLTCAVPLWCLDQSESLGDRGFPPARRCTAAGALQSLSYGRLLSCVYLQVPSAYQPPSYHHLCEETWKRKKVNRVYEGCKKTDMKHE